MRINWVEGQSWRKSIVYIEGIKVKNNVASGNALKDEIKSF